MYVISRNFFFHSQEDEFITLIKEAGPDQHKTLTMKVEKDTSNVQTKIVRKKLFFDDPPSTEETFLPPHTSSQMFYDINEVEVSRLESVGSTPSPTNVSLTGADDTITTVPETPEHLSEVNRMVFNRPNEHSSDENEVIVNRFLNQTETSTWKTVALEILQQTERGLKTEKKKFLSFHKATCNLRIHQEYRLSHFQVRLLCAAATEHKVVIDASENTITLPIGGEIYIFNCAPLPIDWKNHCLMDGHHWKLKYHTYPVTENFDKRKFEIIDENRMSSCKFQKYAYYNTQSKVLLIHYLGNEEDAPEVLHGNSKHKRNLFHQGSKMIRENVLASKQEKSGSKICSNLTTKANPETIAATAPRDSRTVQYYQQQGMQTDKLHANEIAATFITANYMGSFVIDMHITPHLVIVCVSDRGADELIFVCQNITIGKRLVLHYDTTFQYGDYFLSVLCYRHPLVERSSSRKTNVNNEAIVPLAIIIHHKKSTFVHADALKTIAARLDGGNSESKHSFSNTPKVFVSDREFMGSDMLPNTTNLWCHLHLRKNTKEKAHRLGHPQEECIAIGRNIDELLKSQSPQSYYERREQFMQTDLWTSRGFNTYFQQYVNGDILRGAARWLIEDYGIEHSEKGITNNASEALNSALHHEGGKLLGKQNRVDLALMKVKYFIDSRDIEINRAYHGQGDYQIKDQIFKKSLKDIPTYKLLTPEEMIKEYKAIAEPGYERELEETPLKVKWDAVEKDTVKDVADFYVEHKLIRAVPNTQYYMGINIAKNYQPFIVDIQNNKCFSCTKAEICPHILAANIVQKGPEGVQFAEKKRKKTILRTTFASPTSVKKRKQFGSKKPRKDDIHHKGIHGSQENKQINFASVVNQAYSPPPPKTKKVTKKNLKTITKVIKTIKALPKIPKGKTSVPQPKVILKVKITPRKRTPSVSTDVISQQTTPKKSLRFESGIHLMNVQEIETNRKHDQARNILCDHQVIRIMSNRNPCYLIRTEPGMSIVEYHSIYVGSPDKFYCNACQSSICEHVQAVKLNEDLTLAIRNELQSITNKPLNIEDLYQVIEYFQTGRIEYCPTSSLKFNLLKMMKNEEDFVVTLKGFKNKEGSLGQTTDICGNTQCQKNETKDCLHILAGQLYADIIKWQNENFKDLILPLQVLELLQPILSEGHWGICNVNVTNDMVEMWSNVQTNSKDFMDYFLLEHQHINQRILKLLPTTKEVIIPLDIDSKLPATPLKNILKTNPEDKQRTPNRTCLTTNNTKEKTTIALLIEKYQSELGLYSDHPSYNEPYALEKWGLENEVTTIPTIELTKKEIKAMMDDNNIPPLPTNQARKYVLQGTQKSTFVLYSPKRGECMVFTEGNVINPMFTLVAANAVKHGAEDSMTRTEKMVSVIHEEYNTITDDYIYTFMANHKVQRRKGSIKVSEYIVHCYCNSIFSESLDKQEKYMTCGQCQSRYHKQCLSENELQEMKCSACTAGHLVQWASGIVTNTCPFDNTLQALCLWVQEHEYTINCNFPKDIHHNILWQSVMDSMENKDSQAQLNWYENIKQNFPQGFYQHDGNKAISLGLDDMFGSPLNITWLPLQMGGTVSFTQQCTSSQWGQSKYGCTATRTQPKKDVLSLMSPDLESVIQPKDVVQILIEGEDMHGKGFPCASCKYGRIVKGPLKLLNPNETWFVNFEGSNTGITAADNQTDLMKLEDICIDGVVFEPKVIVSLKNNIHYTSLIKFKGKWFYYDGMAQKKIRPALPSDYENLIFDHMTFIRKIAT